MGLDPAALILGRGGKPFTRIGASMRSHVLGELTSAELASLSPEATLVIPIGATEQHGPRLPVATDALVSERIADMAAAATRSAVLVAPVLAYGSSHHHLPLSGTLSLRGRTLLAVLGDLLDSAARTGFRRAVVFNGHGGNDDLVRQAARDAVLDHDITVAAASYWSLGGDTLAAVAGEAGIRHVPGHAGAFEAALLLGLGVPIAEGGTAPGRTGGVLPMEADGVFVAEHDWIARMNGTTDPVTPATPEAGRRLLDYLVAEFAGFLDRFAHAA